MTDKTDLQRLVGQVIMDPTFRKEFFAAVAAVSPSLTTDATKLTVGGTQVELTAQQVRMANKYRQKCLDELLACMKGDNDVDQEAW